MSTRDVEALGFAAEARAAFAAISVAHDLVETSSSLHEVTFKGPHGVLSVLHDPRSCELDIAFIPNAATRPETQYDLADLMRVTDPAGAHQYRSFMASTAPRVREGLERLAHELGTYGARALAGDAAFLGAVEECRAQAIEQSATQRARSQNAAEAGDAFKRGEWATTVSIYERMGDLDEVQTKRLAIARRRLAGP